MNQEDIDLLFKDLCARLPYGVKVNFAGYSGREDCTLNVQHLNSTYSIEYLRMKPYLRPMSSMTEEEEIAFLNKENHEIYDWLYEHHFDVRNLIEKNLALEAPSEMY